jgi:hypothetical protein
MHHGNREIEQMGQRQDSQGSSGQSEDDEESQASSSRWLLQGKNGDRKVPKSEHPSTYDESIPALSYRAQNTAQIPSPAPETQKSSAQNPQKSRQSSNADLASDADAFETTYRPYSQYTGRWQVPPWARPQQNNTGTLRLLILLIIDIVVFPALCVFLQGVTMLHLGALNLLLIPFIVLFVALGGLLLSFTMFAFLSMRGKTGRIKPPRWW